MFYIFIYNYLEELPKDNWKNSITIDNWNQEEKDTFIQAPTMQ